MWFLATWDEYVDDGIFGVRSMLFNHTRQNQAWGMSLQKAVAWVRVEKAWHGLVQGRQAL